MNLYYGYNVSGCSADAFSITDV